MSEKIAVYGGKFDPPHNGHLMAAEWTREEFGHDKVLFMTSASPPHKKKGVLAAKKRHQMVKAAVKANCYFEACDLELKRKGPSYTLLTMRQLREKYGDDAEIDLMISAEYLDPDFDWRIDRWEGAEELFTLCNLLVFPRDNMGIGKIRRWSKLIPDASIRSLKCPTPPISSSMIRDRVERFKSIWYMVPAEVWELIRDQRHYIPKGVTPPAKYYGRCAETNT